MKLNKRRAHPFSVRRRGAVAVELALVLPLLLTLLIGVWDLGRLINVTQILNNAVREGGRCTSTGKVSASETQAAVLNYLKQAGLETDGATVTVTNLSAQDNPDPRSALQLDEFQVSATLPSANVRWIAMDDLIGSNTLTASCVWKSMRDVPLTVPASIPIN